MICSLFVEIGLELSRGLVFRFMNNPPEGVCEMPLQKTLSRFSTTVASPPPPAPYPPLQPHFIVHGVMQIHSYNEGRDYEYELERPVKTQNFLPFSFAVTVLNVRGEKFYMQRKHKKEFSLPLCHANINI